MKTKKLKIEIKPESKGFLNLNLKKSSKVKIKPESKGIFDFGRDYLDIKPPKSKKIKKKV